MYGQGRYIKCYLCLIPINEMRKQKWKEYSDFFLSLKLYTKYWKLNNY